MRILLALPAVLVCITLFDTAPLEAQAAIPIRELSPPDAKAIQRFGIIRGVRPLENGGVLINDSQFRQLLAFDAQLENRRVILDSVNTGGQSYAGGVALVPGLGDSTFFIDSESKTLLVIAPNGTITRITSAPRTDQLNLIGGPNDGVDANGNLLYRGERILPPRPTGAIKPNPNAARPASIDSAPILRANFETRAVDTVARVKLPNVTVGRTIEVNGEFTSYLKYYPIAVVDEYAVLSSGTLAILRNHDYHVDFIATDGTLTKSAKLPFDWRVMTDAEKQHIIDSARVVLEKRAADSKARESAAGTPTDTNRLDVQRRSRSAAASQMAYKPITEVIEFVGLDELPGFWPTIRENAVKADLDNNLWILPTTTSHSKNGELVYDVVNAKGELFQRVRLPLGRRIVGFGKHGVVFLAVKDDTPTPVGMYLEKTHLLNNGR